MRPRVTRCAAVLAASVLCTACYPSRSALPARAPAADISLPEVRNLEPRLRSCHALREALFARAYEQRRQVYYLRQTLAVLAAVGGGMSAMLNGRSGRTVGGVLAVLSSVTSTVLPPAAEEGEGLQNAARQANEAWTGAEQELESVEIAARAYQAHLRDRPRPLPAGATVEATADWLERRRGWEEALLVHRRVYGEHYAALSARVASCTSIAHGLAMGPDSPAP